MAGQSQDEILSNYYQQKTGHAPQVVPAGTSSGEAQTGIEEGQGEALNNEQAIRSLAFYIDYMRQNLEYSRQDFEDHRDDLGDFISGALNEAPLPSRIKQRISFAPSTFAAS